MSELDFIEKVSRVSRINDSIEIGIGDDCSVMQDKERKLVTVDMLSDMVHFDTNKDDPKLIGRKSLAVSLSDIAAMGGEAKQAYVSININKNKPEIAEKAMFAIADLASDFGVSLAGGDTNSWDGPLVISTTVIGYSHTSGPVLRSGAKENDIICVTGPLGGSIHGKHLTFTPRITEIKEIMDQVRINAMIDISDGLAKDLQEICNQSNLAAVIDLKRLPISKNIEHLNNREERALTDGEDFELCLTLSADEFKKFQTFNLEAKLYPIGHMTKGSGLYHRVDDNIKALDLKGYEHNF